MPSPKSRWAPVGCFAVASSANQMAWLVFAPVSTTAAVHYRVSTTSIGLLSEIFPLAYVVLAMPAGRLVDRSLSTWLTAGVAVDAAGTLVRLGGLGRSGFAWALTGQVLVAAAQPLLLASVTPLAQRYLLPADRPTGIALGSAGTFAGFILAYVVGGILGGARAGVILVVGALYATGAGAALAGALWRHRCTSDRNGPAARTGPSPAAATRLRALWADPVMRRLGAMVACGFGVFVSLTTWAETLLVPAGVTAGTVDAFLTAMLVAGALTSAVLPGPVARRGSQLPVLVSGGIATVLACAVMAGAPGEVSAAVCLLVIGALLLPALPVVLEVTERRYPSDAATAGNFLWLAGNAGGIVTALVTGLVDNVPWLSFTVMAVIMLGAAPFAAALKGKLGSPVTGPVGASMVGTSFAGTPGAVASSDQGPASRVT